MPIWHNVFNHRRVSLAMARYVVLGGTGMMGQVAVKDLYESTHDEIVLVGSTLEKARRFAKGYGRRVTPAGVDVRNVDATAKLLKGADVAVNCVQYYFNLHIMRAALKAGTHYVDLGGLFHMTKKQLKLHARFKRARLTAILGMGSTPGIMNVLAAHGAKQLDRVESMHLHAGWKDFSTFAGREPVLPYSLATLIDEFTMKPAIYKNGKMAFGEPASGRIEMDFPRPIGKQSEIYTIHSELATFPSSFRHKGIRNASFRVGFEGDFIGKVRFLVDLGLTGTEPVEYKGRKIVPREFVSRVAGMQPGAKARKVEDYECLRVELRGSKGGRQRTLYVDCMARSHPKWKLFAGDIDTGTPPSIAAQMIQDGRIAERGAFPPEYHVPQQQFFNGL